MGLGIGGTVGGGAGLGIGHTLGYNSGAEIGQEEAFRDLVKGIYAQLADTAAQGRKTEIPGMRRNWLTPDLAAPQSQLKQATHMEIFEKAAKLGWLQKNIMPYIGKGVQKVGEGAHRLNQRMFGVGTKDSLKRTYGNQLDEMDPMDPKYRQKLKDFRRAELDASVARLSPHSAVEKGKLVLGGGGLGLGLGFIPGNITGRIGQYDKGHEAGYGQGYDTGGYDTLQEAARRLQATYGGLGGRWRGLVGGSRPGTSALAQLGMEQFPNMFQQ